MLEVSMIGYAREMFWEGGVPVCPRGSSARAPFFDHVFGWEVQRYCVDQVDKVLLRSVPVRPAKMRSACFILHVTNESVGWHNRSCLSIKWSHSSDRLVFTKWLEGIIDLQ